MNNGVGIAGIAGWNGVAGQPDANSVKIIPVKALYNDGTHAFGGTDAMYVTKAIDWVANLSVNGKKIISMSLTTSAAQRVRNPYGTQTLQDAVSEAHTSGCLLVASTGNDGQTQPHNASTNYTSSSISGRDFCFLF